MKRKVYISGPISDATAEQLHNFGKAERILSVSGFDCINPLKLGAEIESNTAAGVSVSDILLFDLGHLASCDLMVCLPGSSVSQGCAVEVAFAEACGIDIQHVFDPNIHL